MSTSRTGASFCRFAPSQLAGDSFLFRLLAFSLSCLGDRAKPVHEQESSLGQSWSWSPLRLFSAVPCRALLRTSRWEWPFRKKLAYMGFSTASAGEERRGEELSCRSVCSVSELACVQGGQLADGHPHAPDLCSGWGLRSAPLRFGAPCVQVRPHRDLGPDRKRREEKKKTW